MYTQMIKNKKNIIKIVVSLLLTLIFIAIVYYLVKGNIKLIVSDLKNIHYKFLILALLLHFFILSIKAYRLNYISGKGKYNLCFLVSNIGNMLNSILPLKLGEVAYVGLIKNYFKVNYAKSINYLLLMRISDLISIYLFGVLLYPLFFRTTYLNQFFLFSILIALIGIFLFIEKFYIHI